MHDGACGCHFLFLDGQWPFCNRLQFGFLAMVNVVWLDNNNELFNGSFYASRNQQHLVLFLQDIMILNDVDFMSNFMDGLPVKLSWAEVFHGCYQVSIDFFSFERS